MHLYVYYIIPFFIYHDISLQVFLSVPARFTGAYIRADLIKGKRVLIINSNPM